jgi:imidazole glycerol-phosphate synthase subunit HisH
MPGQRGDRMVKIAVIDYDAGNLHSACKALEKAGASPHVTDSARELAQADGVVLPGVGAWDPTLQGIRARHLEAPIKQVIASGKPFLGICMGLQALFESGEEGRDPGLGIVPGMVRRFRPEPGITIPNMGWHQLQIAQPDCGLWRQLPAQPWLYFVHSYYVDPTDSQVRAGMITHGSQSVTVAIAQDNLTGVQFHPEKSADSGLQILANFVQIVTQAQSGLASPESSPEFRAVR